jgi:hypothetical protein
MKPTIKWVLYTHNGEELVILSKKFETKKDAEVARDEYPERERRAIGVGRSL